MVILLIYNLKLHIGKPWIVRPVQRFVPHAMSRSSWRHDCPRRSTRYAYRIRRYAPITMIWPPVTNLDQNLPTQASVRSKPVLFFSVINPPQTGSTSGSTNWLSAVSLPGEKLFCLIASVPLIVVFFLPTLGCFFSICRYRYNSQINFNTCRSACPLLALIQDSST